MRLFIISVHVRSCEFMWFAFPLHPSPSEQPFNFGPALRTWKTASVHLSILPFPSSIVHSFPFSSHAPPPFSPRPKLRWSICIYHEPIVIVNYNYYKRLHEIINSDKMSEKNHTPRLYFALQSTMPLCLGQENVYTWWITGVPRGKLKCWSHFINMIAVDFATKRSLRGFLQSIGSEWPFPRVAGFPQFATLYGLEGRDHRSSPTISRSSGWNVI